MSGRSLREAGNERWQRTLEGALRASGQSVYEVDLQEGALRWPLAGDTVLGHPTARLANLGQWLDCVHPEDRLLAQAALVGSSGTPGPDPVVPCIRFLDPSGATRWLEVSSLRERRDGRDFGVGMLVDVTARREAARHREFPASVLRGLREAVVVVDGAGCIHWHNAAFAAQCGLPGELLVSRALADFCCAAEARRIEQQQDIRDAVRRRGAWQGRVDVRRADGRIAFTEACVTLLPGTHEELWVHVRRDVTERVELEEAAVAATRAEQRQLGLELHDRLGQELAGTSMLVRTLRNAMAAGGPPDPQLLGDVEHLLQGAVARCRDLAQGVSPFLIADGGLGAAIEDLLARTRRGAALEMRAGLCPRTARLDGNFGYHLFRIVQLALATLLHREGVSRIDLQAWHEEDDRVALALVADGRRDAAGGADLRMLAHRLALLGGTWEPLEAGQGRSGVIAMVPLPGAGEARPTRPPLARPA
ncbi:MAG: PAS domain S-box protein [Steroidobacteraceae bacterium]|jgi:PAS domain S-box-containing protein|nr:PAS domain S-box protein [Steroidobacteraceae bacterium]